ncbi:MAG: ammonium transporter [Acidimicrobiales bacterium]
MPGALAPYPHWLVPGDNTWQLVAATLVGMMSIPGLAVLYGGLVPRKWSVNTMVMAFAGFAIVLLVWVLWAFKMSFGTPLGGHGFLGNLVGHPGTVISAAGEQGQATIPLISGIGGMPAFHFPMSTLAYFQFVFAAITPLLFLGSVLGRIKFKAWIMLVPLWTTFVYAINAFLLWGGGWFAQQGALDYSGGYVIHLSAGVSGFVAAAMVGPRLRRDRQQGVPTNLMLIAVGAGILWLGWNGFNGGDPYFAGADAAAAILNTNLATAAALLTWVVMDMKVSRQRKPTLLGGVNGMICGLVAITPSAGWVSGGGAILIGIIASAIVWLAWTLLPRVRPFSKVDDALGVVYTHGIAGLAGGLLLGVFGDPAMVEYLGTGGTASFSVRGLLYSGSAHQLLEQLLAALWVIGFSALGTAVVCYVVKVAARGLRMSDEELEVGDLAVHHEEVMPVASFAQRGPAAVPAAPGSPPPGRPRPLVRSQALEET